MSLCTWVFAFSLFVQVRYTSHESRRAVLSDVAMFVRFARRRGLGDIASVRVEHLQEFVRDRCGGSGNDGPRTIHRRISSVRTWFRYLVKRGAVASNPADELELAPIPRRLPRVLTVEEVESLLCSLRGNGFVDRRDRAVLEVLYSSGMRVGELCGLKDEDVRDDGAVRVFGKGAKERFCLLSRPAMVALAAYRTARTVFLATHGRESTYLFINDECEPISRSAARHAVRRALLAAGMDPKKGSPHTLRHSFATHMVDGGADLNTVMEMLGHTSLQSTQTYLHTSTSRQRRVWEFAHPRANVGVRGGFQPPPSG